MTKHHEYYQLMLTKEADLFKQFSPIHDQYVLDPAAHQTEFNQIGEKVRDVVTDYENRLCHHSEKGKYAAYSHTLADKFWALVRADFPKIDDVGIEISYLTPPPPSRPKPPPAPKNLRFQSSDEIFDSLLDDAVSRLTKTAL